MLYLTTKCVFENFRGGELPAKFPRGELPAGPGLFYKDQW